VVPAELAPFKELFLRFGAHHEFSADQFTSFLADLATSTAGEPLSAQELDQALAVSQVCGRFIWQETRCFCACNQTT